MNRLLILMFLFVTNPESLKGQFPKCIEECQQCQFHCIAIPLIDPICGIPNCTIDINIGGIEIPAPVCSAGCKDYKPGCPNGYFPQPWPTFPFITPGKKNDIHSISMISKHQKFNGRC